MNNIKRYKEEVKEQIENPLDDLEIKKYLPDTPIYTYNKLANISDITELLPSNKSSIIILYLETPNSGHWCSLMRYGKKIEFFCSYASKIDAPLLWLPIAEREPLGTSNPYLTKLLNKALDKGFKVVYNAMPFQSKKGDVATCGRHSILRIQKMKDGFDLKNYQKWIKNIREEEGLSFDEIVSIYIQT